jgi:hypothetical protein
MFDLKDMGTWPIIYLECMDSDFLEFNDDCLGYSYLWLSDTSYYINNLKPKVKPIWQQLYLPLSNRPQGQILMSFFILDKEKYADPTIFIKEISIVPEIKKYTIEINILGLRDLQPLSLIPVKKPFIIFDINSINFGSAKGSDSPDKDKKMDDSKVSQVSSIKTQPKESGANPNINTVLKFDVNLPNDETFLPQLQCMVNDSMLAGLFNQLLGIFMIPLKAIIKEHQVAFESDLKTLKKNKLKYEHEIRDYMTKKVGEKVIKEALVLEKLKEEDKKDVEIFINDGNEKSKLIPLEENKSQTKSMPKSKSIKKAATQEMLFKEDEPEDENMRIISRPLYKKYVLPGIKESSPNYKEYQIEDESKKPPADLWMEVGFNKGEEDNLKYKKHFRRKFFTELEKANVIN